MFACRFGRGRSDAEKFLAALQDVYCLERVRVLGDDIRLLKCYPGDWQVSLKPYTNQSQTSPKPTSCVLGDDICLLKCYPDLPAHMVPW